MSQKSHASKEADDRAARLEKHYRLENAKLNTQRVYHVVAHARTFLMDSRALYTQPGGDFDRLEAMLCAAVALLVEMHQVMTEGDDVIDVLPGVL